jgi:hypothetical protein
VYQSGKQMIRVHDARDLRLVHATSIKGIVESSRKLEKIVINATNAEHIALLLDNRSIIIVRLSSGKRVFECSVNNVNDSEETIGNVEIEFFDNFLIAQCQHVKDRKLDHTSVKAFYHNTTSDSWTQLLDRSLPPSWIVKENDPPVIVPLGFQRSLVYVHVWGVLHTPSSAFYSGFIISPTGASEEIARFASPLVQARRTGDMVESLIDRRHVRRDLVQRVLSGDGQVLARHGYFLAHSLASYVDLWTSLGSFIHDAAIESYYHESDYKLRRIEKGIDEGYHDLFGDREDEEQLQQLVLHPRMHKRLLYLSPGRMCVISSQVEQSGATVVWIQQFKLF